MKLNPIKACIAGMLLSSAVSCKKHALRPAAHPMLTKSTKVLVYYLAKEGEKITGNPEYKCFAHDTISLGIHMSASCLNRRLDARMKRAIPKTKIGEKAEEKLKLVGKVLYLSTDTVDVEIPNYIDTKAVIENSYYTYSWYSVDCVPVKYYGIPNPELKNIYK